jgi:hypothetical protein
MTVHLLKMAVGVESIQHLKELQAERFAKAKSEGFPGLRHMTRNLPKRSDELLDGGSIYWVIAGVIRVRQRLKDVMAVANKDGLKRCALILDRKLVRVEPRSKGPFQGWRYLELEDAPADLTGAAAKAAELPQKMADELRDLGLL